MRTRRTRAEVELALREATLGELADRGYAGVTFEGVARRAGASKPVLYRRFPDRAHMVAAAITALLAEVEDAGLRLPGTSLRDDLLTVLTGAASEVQLLGPGNFRALVGDADDDLLASLDEQSTRSMIALVGEAVRAAQWRGEIGSAPVPGVVVRVPVVLVRDRMLFGHLDQATIEQIVDVIALPLFTTAST